MYNSALLFTCRVTILEVQYDANKRSRAEHQTQADKGKTLVIIYKHDYFNKIYTFLSENNFHILQNNPINKDQTRIHKTQQQCNLNIHKKQIKYLIQKKTLPLLQ